jgi:hypothetical protein
MRPALTSAVILCLAAIAALASPAGARAQTQIAQSDDSMVNVPGPYIPCPAGTIFDGTNCSPCPTGQVPASDTSCESCPSGWIANSSASCEACSSGTFPDATATSCISCPSGQTYNGTSCVPQGYHFPTVANSCSSWATEQYCPSTCTGGTATQGQKCVAYTSFRRYDAGSGGATSAMRSAGYKIQTIIPNPGGRAQTDICSSSNEDGFACMPQYHDAVPY